MLATPDALYPALSVIVPTYNSAGLLMRALDSALAQSVRPAEIVVIDDGSSDDTGERVAALARTAPLPIRYHRQDNAGPAAARNRGAAMAASDHLLFLDADDRLLPEALRRFSQACAATPDLEFVFGGRVDVRPDGVRKLRQPPPLTGNRVQDFLDYLRRHRPVIGPGCAVIHRRLFERIRYPEEIRVAEDFVFYSRMLALGRCGCFYEPVIEHFIDETRGQDRVLHCWRDLRRSVELLFDPALLPRELMRYRPEYEARVELTLFRAFHRAGQDRTARAFYHRALARSPMRALRPTYLRKYLRGIVGLSHPMVGQ